MLYWILYVSIVSETWSSLSSKVALSSVSFIFLSANLTIYSTASEWSMCLLSIWYSSSSNSSDYMTLLSVVPELIPKIYY